MSDRLSRLDAIDLDQFEDYDSDELGDEGAQTDREREARGRNAFIGDMWGRYGYGAGTRADMAQALVVAHKMVQTVVDTFATPGQRFRVAFDPGLSTAGTDLVGRAVAITPAPVFDETLTPQQAGVILTAMGTHEVSHDRYGRPTHAAVKRVFGSKRAPSALSNILDDVRIERRFAADYPGYADVFAPMLEYVARAWVKKNHGKRFRPEMSDLVNLAGFAIRYDRFVDWHSDEVRAEREWWRAWADRWAREDAPRRHVEAVREGLRHIVVTQQKVARPKKKKDQEVPAYVQDFRDAFAGLTPMARKAMRLASEGRSGEEIAATLGLKLETTRLLLREGRRQLAAQRVTKITMSAAASDLLDSIASGAASMGGDSR